MGTTPVQLAMLSVGAVLAGTITYFLAQRHRNSPEDRERKRRSAVNRGGRLIEGLVTEVKDGVVFYSYSWRGIDYDCSQDLSTMAAWVPAQADSLIGPVTVKFLPRNPYNSIVLCESWSGFPLRNRKRIEY
jgi:hypothetical protein